MNLTTTFLLIDSKTERKDERKTQCIMFDKKLTSLEGIKTESNKSIIKNTIYNTIENINSL